MGRPRKKLILVKRCLHCGQNLENTEFYKSNGSIYVGNDNYIPVCKDCMKVLYEKYRIKYANQYSILSTESEEKKVEELAIKRMCMAFDIYYSEWLFETALKQIEKFSTLDMITAYMRVVNLKQNCMKSYDDTTTEENMAQELLKFSMANKIRKFYADDELYEVIHNLCLKLLQILRKHCDIKE